MRDQNSSDATGLHGEFSADFYCKNSAQDKAKETRILINHHQQHNLCHHYHHHHHPSGYEIKPVNDLFKPSDCISLLVFLMDVQVFDF